MYYMDREGHRIKKTTSQDKFLKFVYTHTATRVLMRPLLLPAVSRLGGKLLNTKVSAVFAGLFARTHGIDLNKYEKQKCGCDYSHIPSGKRIYGIADKTGEAGMSSGQNCSHEYRRAVLEPGMGEV